MSVKGRDQHGFTLIELMIVVAIIAILSTLAIPAYNDYVPRSQFTEGANLFAGVRTVLAEYGSNTSQWPSAIQGPLVSTGATEIIATRIGRYAELSDTVAGTYPTGTVTVTMTGSRTTGTILFVTSDGARTGPATPAPWLRPSTVRRRAVSPSMQAQT